MATTDKDYQVYTATMQSFKMVRTDGKVLHIIGGKHITKDKADIEYLDAEIAAGCHYLKKGDKVTAADADPMSAMREQIKKDAIKEYLAKEAAELEADDTPKGTTTQNPVIPASTSDLLAGLKAKSDSK